MNRKAFNRINYGLFLVGAVLDGKYQGCVVNSLHQITSSNPAKFSLSLNKSNETYKAVEAAGSFAATVLERGTPKELVDLFGYKSGRVVDKYEGFQVETDGAGQVVSVTGNTCKRGEAYGRKEVTAPTRTVTMDTMEIMESS